MFFHKRKNVKQTKTGSSVIQNKTFEQVYQKQEAKISMLYSMNGKNLV